MAEANGNVDWPLVVPNDDGIRPAGPADACFYCGRKVGEPHKTECVVVHKKVLVRYEFEIEIEVPHHWDLEMVAQHRNNSSWCAGNALDDIEKYQKAKGDECLCPEFTCLPITVSDNTPTRDTRTDEQMAETTAIRESLRQ